MPPSEIAPRNQCRSRCPLKMSLATRNTTRNAAQSSAAIQVSPPATLPPASTCISGQAAGGSVAGGETWMAALDWAAFLVVFLVAKDILSGQRERHWFLGAISLLSLIHI